MDANWLLLYNVLTGVLELWKQRGQGGGGGITSAWGIEKAFMEEMNFDLGFEWWVEFYQMEKDEKYIPGSEHNIWQDVKAWKQYVWEGWEPSMQLECGGGKWGWKWGLIEELYGKTRSD